MRLNSPPILKNNFFSFFRVAPQAIQRLVSLKLRVGLLRHICSHPRAAACTALDNRSFPSPPPQLLQTRADGLISRTESYVRAYYLDLLVSFLSQIFPLLRGLKMRDARLSHGATEIHSPTPSLGNQKSARCLVEAQSSNLLFPLTTTIIDTLLPKLKR